MKKVTVTLFALLALTGCSSQTPEEENWTATPEVVDTTTYTSGYSIADPTNKCISYDFEMPDGSSSDPYNYYHDAASEFEDKVWSENWREQGSDALQHAIAEYLKGHPETKFSMSENCPSQKRLDEVHARQKEAIEQLKLDQKEAIEQLQLDQKETIERYNSKIATLEACMLTDATEPIPSACYVF